MPILKLPASSNEEAIYFIEIYFDTSTYDVVEQDKKMTLEAQLGLIGGTMGLLTGFSILSGVEILYYAIRFFVSLRISKADIVTATDDKFKNHLTWIILSSCGTYLFNSVSHYHLFDVKMYVIKAISSNSEFSHSR